MKRQRAKQRPLYRYDVYRGRRRGQARLIGAAGCAVFGLLLVLIRSLGIRFSGAAALIFDDVAVLPQGTVTGWLVVAYLALLCTCLSYVLQNTALTRLPSYTVSLLQCTQPILTAACSYLLLGGEAVGDRTGGSGAYRGLRGAGKLAERPKTNRIRIRGRSFLNVLLFSYKETFAVEIGRFLTIVMCDAG